MTVPAWWRAVEGLGPQQLLRVPCAGGGGDPLSVSAQPPATDSASVVVGICGAASAPLSARQSPGAAVCPGVPAAAPLPWASPPALLTPRPPQPELRDQVCRPQTYSSRRRETNTRKQRKAQQTQEPTHKEADNTLRQSIHTEKRTQSRMNLKTDLEMTETE